MGNNLNIQTLYGKQPKRSNAVWETNLNIQTLSGKQPKHSNTLWETI